MVEFKLGSSSLEMKVVTAKGNVEFFLNILFSFEKASDSMVDGVFWVVRL